MTTLTATMEDTLLIRARELRTMIEDPTCDNGARQDLTRGYFRLLRRLRDRGVNFYATRGEPYRSPPAAEAQAARSAPRTGGQTFLFADLVGFTALTAAGGNELAAEVATHFHRRVGGIVPEYGATVIKTLGDGLMIRVDDPAEAMRLGVRIATRVGRREGLPSVRVGVHTGEAVERAGDWFGHAVNVAAGLVKTACEGEVLVSGSTRAAARLPVGVELQSAGRSEFKVGAEPVEVYSATPQPATGESHRAAAEAPADCPPVRPCPKRC